LEVQRLSPVRQLQLHAQAGRVHCRVKWPAWWRGGFIEVTSRHSLFPFLPCLVSYWYLLFVLIWCRRRFAGSIRGKTGTPRAVDQEQKTKRKNPVGTQCLCSWCFAVRFLINPTRTCLHVRPGSLTILECRFNKTTHHPQ